MVKELHIVLSDEDHKRLSDKKHAAGLVWRDLLYKALNEPCPRTEEANTHNADLPPT